MTETMFQYIEETPVQCRENIQNSALLTKAIVGAFLEKDYQRIEIVASGSSYNGASTARYYMEKVLKMKVEVLTSFTVNCYETIFDTNTFYIGMGQSGRSTNTNNAMQKIRDHGCHIVGVTGNTDSVMKEHCDVICNWGLGIEKIGFVTKGYSTSVLFYMLFALEAAKAKEIIDSATYDTYKKQLFTMTDVMEQAIPKAYAWYSRNAEEFKQTKRIQIIGYGPGYGAANEGALKIEETYGKACSGYEFEEFMHGPCYEINEECAVVVLDVAGEAQDRAIKLYQKIHTLTPLVYLITNQTIDDPRVLTIPHELDEYTSVLAVIIALQTIGAHAREEWVNPNLSRRVAFCEEMNVKAPKTGREVGL